MSYNTHEVNSEFEPSSVEPTYLQVYKVIKDSQIGTYTNMWYFSQIIEETSKKVIIKLLF